MKLNEKVLKVDKTFTDLKKFVDSGEYEYGAMLVRTIVEIIVNSYTDYYVPEIKNAEQVPTIMEQIKALDQSGFFPKAQIYNLHEMRKLSNKGAHQSDEETVNAIEIKAIIPILESEIDTWKQFTIEGHESLIEKDKARQNAILNGTVEKNPVKAVISLVATIIVFAFVLYFSYKQTVQFYTMELHYETSGLLIYWGCFFVFVLFAAYCRSYGVIQKILYDLLAIYFGVPRIYQIYLCFTGHGSFFDMAVYLILASGIIGGYTIIALYASCQKGGIVGYK